MLPSASGSAAAQHVVHNGIQAAQCRQGSGTVCRCLLADFAGGRRLCVAACVARVSGQSRVPFPGSRVPSGADLLVGVRDDAGKAQAREECRSRSVHHGRDRRQDQYADRRAAGSGRSHGSGGAGGCLHHIGGTLMALTRTSPALPPVDARMWEGRISTVVFSIIVIIRPVVAEDERVVNRRCDRGGRGRGAGAGVGVGHVDGAGDIMPGEAQNTQGYIFARAHREGVGGGLRGPGDLPQDRLVWAVPILAVMGVQLASGGDRVSPGPSVAIMAMSRSFSTVPAGLFPTMDVPAATPAKVTGIEATVEPPPLNVPRLFMFGAVTLPPGVKLWPVGM